jgi:cystathionine beta-synthase
MIHGSKATILDAVGGTPIVRLQRVVPPEVDVALYARCEFMSPTGSARDRVAAALLRGAEADGRLRAGGTVVSATGGNAGASLAMVAAVRGYRCVFAVPDKTSQEKLAALRAWGARVVLCPATVDPADPRSHYAVARRIADETPGAVLADQHHAPAAVEHHATVTGPELWAQTAGDFDAVVVPLRTGATAVGLARYLKTQRPDVQVVGVDAVGSVFHDYVKHGVVTRPFAYKVEGVGLDFVPAGLDLRGLDDCVRVDDRECFVTARDLVRQEGLWCGGSSGAAVAGAIKWARGRRGGLRVVVFLEDSASRYLSTLFNDDWMRENGFAEPETALGTVAELLANRAQTLVTARPDDTLRNVIGKMKGHGVSQLPVIDGDAIRGLVSEVDVLRNLVSGEAHLDATIERILDSDYATVSPDTRVDLLKSVLADAKVALVTDGARLLGIVSKIDVIDYLSRRMGDAPPTP